MFFIWLFSEYINIQNFLIFLFLEKKSENNGFGSSKNQLFLQPKLKNNLIEKAPKSLNFNSRLISRTNFSHV